MKIRPDELTENGYILMDKFSHQELVPFIRDAINKKTWSSAIYYLSNFIIFGLAGFFLMKGHTLPGFSLSDRLTHFAYGIAITFLIIPLHEYIHVLAYQSQGATQTSYDVNLKKFYFLALADKFVANRKEFQIIALAPFTLITAILLVLLFVVSSTWLMTIFGILLTHTAMTSGDFGLLSYFEYHKDKGVVTYDDVESKTSYFYGKEVIGNQ